MVWVHLLNELLPLLNTTQEEITFLESKYVAKLDQMASSCFPSFLLILFLLFQLFVLSLLGSTVVNYLNSNFSTIKINLSMSDQMIEQLQAEVPSYFSVSRERKDFWVKS